MLKLVSFYWPDWADANQASVDYSNFSVENPEIKWTPKTPWPPERKYCPLEQSFLLLKCLLPADQTH